MKKLKFILIVIFPCFALAQKYSSIDSIPGAPVFVYTHNSPMDLIRDRKYIEDNTKIYAAFLNRALNQNLLTDKAKTYYILETLEQANIVLGDYSAAEKAYENNLVIYPPHYLYYFPDRIYLDVKMGRENSYMEAIDKQLNKMDRKSFEMISEYVGPELLHKDLKNNYNTFFTFLSSDSSNLRKSVEANTSFSNESKKLTMTRFSDFLWVYCQNLVADELFNDFVRTDPLQSKKWNEWWDSHTYSFDHGELLHDVLICNFQFFEKHYFDSSVLWVNPGEIAGNHIDDDHNGIIDDIHGYQYNIKDQRIREPVTLEWKGIDSEAIITQAGGQADKIAKRYGGAIEEYKSRFDHGNMSVELMLKGNPRVHVMALEQNQLDGDQNYLPDFIQGSFTNSISHNQYLVDSLVELFIRSFNEMTSYCNHYGVRVVEINSMSVNEKDLFMKGCGRDSIELLEFGRKMFAKLREGMNRAYLLAPNVLFINSAGNDDLNVDTASNILNFIRLPNVMIAGALYKDFKKASYSNFGTGVDVYAPAHFVLQKVKMRSRRYIFLHNESGGTSAAAPVVANLAIKILELKPGLGAALIKQLILDGTDKEPFEKGINIIDPNKTIALLKIAPI
jgi:Subtilase family